MDITQCSGGKCPFKDTCFRFTAKRGERHQSMFTYPPFTTRTEYKTEAGTGIEASCDYWMNNKEGV